MTPSGIARVRVSHNGKVVARDALTLTADKVLTELRLPLRYGGLFSTHDVEILIEFDPPVHPERQR